MVREDHLTVDCPDGWTSTVSRHKVSGISFAVITLHGPDHAVLIYTAYDRQVSTSLLEFADGIAEQRRGSLPGNASTTGGASQAGDTLAVAGMSIETVVQQFDVVVPGARVKHRATFGKLDGTPGTLFVMLQAPSAGWAKAEAAFRSILERTRWE